MTTVLRVLATFIYVMAALLPIAPVADETLTVPLRVILQTGIEIPKGGFSLPSWVSETDVSRVVIPEVNRLWQPAGIQVELLSVTSQPALTPPDRPALIHQIAEAKRNAEGESDPARIDAYYQLIDFSAATPDAVTVVLVPYLGEKSQGNTRRKLKRILVTQWTDKGKGTSGELRRFALTESGEYRQGSLSRTVAHELGHVLGLKHPDKSTQTAFGLLMGGRKPGERLTQTEILQAREHARGLQ